MPHALRAESRTVQRFVGMPGAEKTRLWPTIDALIRESLPDNCDLSEHFGLSGLDVVLIGDILAHRYTAAHAKLGKIVGRDASAGKLAPETNGHFPGGKSLPEREVGDRKPLARSAR